ncbi:MAG TPA: hypothetical protein VFF60_05900 [Candidatus Binatus sp.]|nr:hypothetical protein [Candidatus Binatus sp.]
MMLLGISGVSRPDLIGDIFGGVAFILLLAAFVATILRPSKPKNTQ